MTSCTEVLRISEFEKKKKNSELRFEGSRFFVGVYVMCRAFVVSLSLLMSKNLKLKKVIKSFVPEPISSVFGFPIYISLGHIWLCNRKM